jgi:hypothetical protein
MTKKKEEMYQQCELRRAGVGTIMVSWIPSKYAKKDKVLKIKNGDGWENGWKVTKVYVPKNTETVVASLATSYLHQREVSDV